MAATTLYTGQAELVTVSHVDSVSVAIPHASIDEVRYILEHENGDTLLKFRKTAPTDWDAVTTEAGDGVFSFEVQEKHSKDWPAGKVYLTWHINITDADFVDGYKPMGKTHLFNVEVVNYGGL